MPRRLSDPEWVAFQNTINIEALKLPPWGAVVQWGSMFVLVYVCPGSGSMCQQGEVMLSDISDRADLVRNISGTYDAAQRVWIYYVPQETIARLYEVAQGTLETTGHVLTSVSQTVGQAAGELTGPLLGNLALPLIVVAIVFLFTQTRGR